ncbi:LytTR family DNA-binding domain-containing protein [Polymorphobacter sp.]|uniref:LytTR family DNA-binding domain-containing protein n=1 Tax=Polymorphobacter sp. TaxID=1909290 RepID=UPI003F70277E
MSDFERFRSLGYRGALVAYLFVPLFFGIVFGWLRVSRTYDWSFASALAYWILAVQICWLVQGGATWFVQKMLGPWNPPLILLLILGTMAGTPFVEIAMRTLVETYQYLVIPPELHKPLKPATLATLFQAHFIGSFIWVVSNLAIVHVLGLARFGFTPTRDQHQRAAAADAHGQPEFATRLKRPVGPLCMLKAEQHYLRVVGDHGEDLILYRISDAVREVSAHVDGLQVHRSFWVAQRAVSHSERDARGLALRLHNGILVPVSRSCRAEVIRAGFAQGRPRVAFTWRDANEAAFDAADPDSRANPVAGPRG